MLEVYHPASDGPAEDLALEGWLLERAAEGHATMSWCSWPGPVVVLGYAQDTGDVDEGWCRRNGIPVLRRITGGTGVIHRGDLGVSLALPATHEWGRGITSLYDRFLEVLVPALRSVGGEVERVHSPSHATRVRSPICFEDQLADTVLRGGRKCVGCAQARRRRAVLIHAAVLLGLDCDLYAAVFGVPAERVGAALAPAVEGVPPREVAEAVVGRAGRALGLEPVAAERPDQPGS